MFNFLKSKKPYAPLDPELRKYFEHNLLWLKQEFPAPEIERRKVLRPRQEDFPVQWNASRANAVDVLEIICGNMQIEPKEIELHFYENGMREIDMGGSVIFTEVDPDHPEAAGHFNPEKVNGKFQISIDEALLKTPDELIATLAHELAHVKLLGEKKIVENDEMLTDFATVFFGLGVFNANAAFQFYQNVNSWGYSNLGYLKVEEWAYALALFAFARNEMDPEWKSDLNKTIKSEFERCFQYLKDHEGDIFRFEDGKDR